MTSVTPTSKFLDLGCGPKKQSGHWGVDVFKFDEVDQIFDFEKGDWPLPSGHFAKVYCCQVIEHIRDVRTFLSELHRVSAPGAEVYVETPHFSWIDSWSDPTHYGHFSANWADSLQPGEYLGRVVGEFEIIKSEVEFSRSSRSLIPRFIVWSMGLVTYERYWAFIFPAKNVRTWLRVRK